MIPESFLADLTLYLTREIWDKGLCLKVLRGDHIPPRVVNVHQPHLIVGDNPNVFRKYKQVRPRVQSRISKWYQLNLTEIITLNANTCLSWTQPVQSQVVIVRVLVEEAFQRAVFHQLPVFVMLPETVWLDGKVEYYKILFEQTLRSIERSKILTRWFQTPISSSTPTSTLQQFLIQDRKYIFINKHGHSTLTRVGAFLRFYHGLMREQLRRGYISSSSSSSASSSSSSSSSFSSLPVFSLG